MQTDDTRPFKHFHADLHRRGRGVGPSQKASPRAALSFHTVTRIQTIIPNPSSVYDKAPTLSKVEHAINGRVSQRTKRKVAAAIMFCFKNVAVGIWENTEILSLHSGTNGLFSFPHLLLLTDSKPTCRHRLLPLAGLPCCIRTGAFIPPDTNLARRDNPDLNFFTGHSSDV